MSTSTAVRRRRVLAGGVTLVVVAAVLVVAVRPFGGGASSGGSVKPVATSGPPGSIELRPGFTLSWKQGAFADQGSVRGSEIASPSPPPDWFEPSGKPVEVTVEGARSQPLDLKWAPPSSPGGDSVPVVLHWDATDKAWSVVASGQAGAPATGATTSFSPHWPGWANPKKLAAAVTNLVHSVLGKRTQPPGCSGGPSWAELSPPAIDVVLTCLTTNRSADGTERAEVQLKNNRGYLLEVPVPHGVAYASVEGQPELIRAAVRAFTGRDSVLLSPGQLMTIGFTQPSVGAPVRIDAAPTVVAIAAQLVTELVADSNGLAAVVKAMSDCKVAPNVPFDVKPAINSVGDVGRAMLSCFASLFADPARARQLALEVVAAEAKVDTTAAAADRGLLTKVDELAGKVRFVAVAIKVVDVGSDLIDYVADDWTNHRTGDYTGMSSQLSLKGSKTTAGGATCSANDLADGVAASGARRPTEVREIRCNSGWAIAVVIDPVTGSTDGTNLFHSTSGAWRVLTNLDGFCVSELESQYGVPDAVLRQLVGSFPLRNCSPSSSVSPSSNSCGDSQQIATELGSTFQGHWPSYAHWVDASDFEQYAKPKIVDLATRCGKTFASDVVNNMNVVGPTNRAFIAWIDGA